ncbi:hypothetical protein WMY93_029129 [Mugilogobius chulae]|uniref:USP domain-containing protein n=1 Tax=Mugilogobius chulae TaxID=88201 RepID=A0AAW0MTQ1_9GOBI
MRETGPVLTNGTDDIPSSSKYQQKKAKKQAKKQAKHQRRQQKLDGKTTLDSLSSPQSNDKAEDDEDNQQTDSNDVKANGQEPSGEITTPTPNQKTQTESTTSNRFTLLSDQLPNDSTSELDKTSDSVQDEDTSSEKAVLDEAFIEDDEKDPDLAFRTLANRTAPEKQECSVRSCLYQLPRWRRSHRTTACSVSRVPNASAEVKVEVQLETHHSQVQVETHHSQVQLETHHSQVQLETHHSQVQLETHHSQVQVETHHSQVQVKTHHTQVQSGPGGDTSQSGPGELWRHITVKSSGDTSQSGPGGDTHSQVQVNSGDTSQSGPGVDTQSGQVEHHSQVQVNSGDTSQSGPGGDTSQSGPGEETRHSQVQVETLTVRSSQVQVKTHHSQVQVNSGDIQSVQVNSGDTSQSGPVWRHITQVQVNTSQSGPGEDTSQSGPGELWRHITVQVNLETHHSQVQNGFSICKVNRHVQFPGVLDLAPFCSTYLTSRCSPTEHSVEDSQILYSLYGIVEHSGTMRSGHYTAYVKVRPRRAKSESNSNSAQGDTEPSQGSWFHISDTSVQPVSEAKALSCQAYLLFYERIH